MLSRADDPLLGRVRVALYARVSTADGRQELESQLAPLREFASGKGWAIVTEYTDRTSAQDKVRRYGWRQLLEDARRGRFDLVLVWKLDRAFRSTLHALSSLQALGHEGVGFVSATQPIDTTSSSGRLLFTVLSAVAEIERELISERTKAGMARAKAAGKHIGRPRGRTDTRQRTRRTRRELKLAAGE